MARISMSPPTTNPEREAAILSLLPIVNRIARFLSHKTRAEFGDLLADGYLGAIHAVDRFDPARGVKLSSYAVSVIHGYIMHGIRSRNPWPERAYNIIKRVDDALATLDAQLGHPATSKEIEERFPGYQAARARAHQWSVTSLADRSLPAEDGEVSARIEAAEQKRELAALIGALAPRQQQAITEHYFGEKTLAQIAKEKHLSHQAVQQAHSNGLKRLRKMLEGRSVI